MADDADEVGDGSGERCGGATKQKREEGGGSKETRRRGRERQQLLEGRIQSNPTSQHYLQWKENTLRLAREKLVEAES